MERIRQYIRAYQKLRQYRTGAYEASFARNNLRNTVVIILLLALIMVIDAVSFLFSGDVPAYRIVTFITLVASMLFAAAIVVYYSRQPMNTKYREQFRNVFYTAALLVASVLIYHELQYDGTLYTYMLLLFLVASVPNFKFRETFILVLSVDLIVIAIVWFLGLGASMQAKFFSLYQLLIFYTVFCLGVAVRNHVDYLILMRERSAMKHACETDPLTGLMNRRGMETYVKTRAYQHRAIACIFDVDDFKIYNDTYGHEAGDQCLLAVAETLQHLTSQCDAIAVRYGGEEFVVLFFLERKTEVVWLLNGCMQELQDKKIVAGKKAQLPYVTLSGGIAVAECDLQGDVNAYYKLIAQADQNLYVAKNTGKNKLVG